MDNKELIENISFSSVIKYDERELNLIIDSYINELSKTIREKGIPMIISFKLFSSRFNYFVEKESLIVKTENSKFEIVKGENGVTVNEDIREVTKDLSREDSVTRLIEYQKEKQIACKVYSRLKKKFLPKRKRKGLNRRNK